MSAQPGTEMDLLEQQGSADAAAEVSIPDATADKQLEEPVRQQLGMYFVRVPRPALDDTSHTINKLETELSACFTKLKAINNKFQVKKGEANELRKQLSLARSLRNGSSPEFDEKMTRLKQMRELRKGYLDKIQDYKAGRAGLECRTEEELDEKIAEMEHSIQHDGLTLNAEKQLVKNISKLKSQREKIREFQGAQEGLAQLEAEAKKLKAVIDEIDGEVNILRGERDQAKDIIDDLSKKLTVVNAVIDEFQSERQDIEATKKEVQDQLKALREENDEAMFEFRANRKLGVELRDLVAEGKVEEAKQMAEEQVETYMGKLNSDKAFKQEYIKLWSEQRRYAVSELLPESGNAEGRPAAAGKGGPAGKGKDAATKPSAPLVPQGKAKAEALIAAALQEAGASLAAQRMAQPQQQQPPEPESSEEAEEAEEADSKPEPPARRVVPGASDDLIAVRKAKAPKAVAKHVTELPVLPNYEYELPVASEGKQSTNQLSADELKAQVREEQRQKAAEAEERKKRRQEQQVKKSKQAAQRQRAAEEAAAAAAKAAKAANRAAALAAAAAADVDVASGTDNERDEPLSRQEAAGERAVVAPASSNSKGGKGKGKGKQNVMVAVPAARPTPKRPAKPLVWYQQYSTELAVAAVVLVLLVLVYLAFTSN